MSPLIGQFGQRTVRWLPNALTGARLLVSPALLALILSEEYAIALLLAMVAGASDGLDGMIAKRFRCRSRFGGVMDPLADKAMLWCVYTGLAAMSLAPLWLLLMIVARDAVILCGAAVFRLRVGDLPIFPSIASKINTFFQIVAALWLLMLGAFAVSGEALAWPTGALVGVVAATTAVSGVEYVLGWTRVYAAHALLLQAPKPAPSDAKRAAARARRERSRSAEPFSAAP